MHVLVLKMITPNSNYGLSKLAVHVLTLLNTPKSTSPGEPRLRKPSSPPLYTVNMMLRMNVALKQQNS